MTNNYGTYTNCATGEVKEGKFTSYEELERNRKYAVIAKAQKHDTEAGRNFTFMGTDIRADRREKTILGAVLVLSTYAQYDRGIGLSPLGYSEERLFTSVKVDFAKVLGVSVDVAKKLGTTLQERGYIIKIDKYFYLDNEIAYRGNTNRNDVLKVYHMFTRQLVEYGAKLEHIGAIYLMLPYISYKDNSLYSDPVNCTGILNKSKLAEAMGVGRPFLDSLFNMTIWYKSKELAVFGIFTMVNTDPATRDKKKTVKKIVVNPLILHGDDREVTGILSLFLNNR